MRRVLLDLTVSDREEFRVRVLVFLQDRSMTAGDLAMRVGTTRWPVERLLRGQRVSDLAVRRICAHYPELAKGIPGIVVSMGHTGT